jgi:hypothetical protein
VYLSADGESYSRFGVSRVSPVNRLVARLPKVKLDGDAMTAGGA